MDIFLISLSVLLMVAGFIGSILPNLPGPPLSWLSLILLQFTESAHFTGNEIAFFTIIMILVSVADYLLPVWTSKFTGGTKYGQIGAALGMLIGIFLIPVLGIIIGAFLGAVLAEMIYGMKPEKAVKSGIGALLGLLAGTIIKLLVCVYFLIEMILVLLF